MLITAASGMPMAEVIGAFVVSASGLSPRPKA